MKKFIAVCVFLFAAYFGSSQDNDFSWYLKIQPDNEVSVSYPPGTKFYVIHATNDTVFSYRSFLTEDLYVATEDVDVVIHVSWKADADIYKSFKGSLLRGKSDYVYTHSKSNKETPNAKTVLATGGGYQSNGMKMLSSAYRYDELTEMYDAVLQFSNEIRVEIKAGSIHAYQDGLELTIEGKYLIRTISGTIKLSYDLGNAETWWVFEPK